MAVSDQSSRQRDELPESFETLEEFSAFWDEHSTADYEDVMEAVPARADIRGRRTYLAVAHDLLAPLQEAARRQGVSVETLANLWLREKVAEQPA